MATFACAHTERGPQRKHTYHGRYFLLLFFCTSSVNYFNFKEREGGRGGEGSEARTDKMDEKGIREKGVKEVKERKCVRIFPLNC